MRDIYAKEIKFFTDAGRVQRPLFIVENNSLRIKKNTIPELISEHKKFEDLLQEGLCEFLDVEEEETVMIAMTLDDLKGEKIK